MSTLSLKFNSFRAKKSCNENQTKYCSFFVMHAHTTFTLKIWSKYLKIYILCLFCKMRGNISKVNVSPESMNLLGAIF